MSIFDGLPKTPNLSLNKPGYDNVADIEALNENADILDEEITTIKSNLKNKGSATEPVYFDDSGVPQKTKNFNDYLPLAGGKMTDTVIARSVNDSLLALIGGTNGDNGATLMLYGKDNSTGRFLIKANDGSVKKDFVGTADGELTWDNVSVLNPVGTVIPFAGNSIPKGYLPCNGSAISRTTYAKLFAAIGTTYGSGDGSTTFNLPNLTDKFIQGSDTAGTVKSAGLPNISGKYIVRAFGDYYTVGAEGSFTAISPQPTIGIARDPGTTAGYDYGFTFSAENSNAIYGNSDTVQPPTLTMRYIIKY